MMVGSVYPPQQSICMDTIWSYLESQMKYCITSPCVHVYVVMVILLEWLRGNSPLTAKMFMVAVDLLIINDQLPMQSRRCPAPIMCTTLITQRNWQQL